jgi:phosphoglycolate phosphatase-like HAD superfamily hydrolase
MSGRRLVLWDVDHTLIATRGVGFEIFAEVFERVAGVPLTERVTVTGRSEQAIIRETLRVHGVPEVAFDVYAQALTDGYLRHAAELRERGHALPGAASALDALAAAGLVQTLVTGNVRGVAEIKLQTFGLDRHVDFELGGYAEDGVDRPDLVRAALRRLGAPAADAVVIGDTVADVEAALACGVFVVAVASGRTTGAELAEAGADVVLPDLTDTELVVRVACGHG